MRRKPETLNIAAAKARLPELVERASAGEEMIVARNGKPRARLVPLTAKEPYVYGAGKGRWKGIEAVLDQPLPDDVLEAFHARGQTS